MTIMSYDLEKIVRLDHELRKIARVVDFGKIARKYVELTTELGRKGYGLEIGIKTVFLQFYYDLSDRELENRLRDDLGLRWFCNLPLDVSTPDHTFFCRIRFVLGPKRVGQIFKNILHKAQEQRLVRRVFCFVDSSAVKSKETTWAERDKALAEGEKALNNQNIEKYSADHDARFGCKGKDKFWYGYKRHVSVDMGSGLITKAAATPANVSDAEGLGLVCPNNSMVVADKAYCTKTAQNTLESRGCYSGAILKNNMLEKDFDKDRWLSRIRAPFENVFSKLETRARYRGLAKMQLQIFLEAIVFNVKRLVTIGSPPLFVAGA
jgi:transposase, IS5 family